MMPAFARQGSDNSGSSVASSSSSSPSSSPSSSSSGSVPSSVPSLGGHGHSVGSRFVSTPQESVFDHDDDPRDSLLTYCTTVASFDELDDDDAAGAAAGEPDCYDGPFFRPAPLYRHHYPPRAVPSTPQEFASLFPPSPSGAKRLVIRHDESPLDGNMNVRVDCDAPAACCDPAAAPAGPDRRLTLFHVRMYDQRDRDFSVRRYGRDCGREVAHVKRKVAKPPPPSAPSACRPALQRSVSRAFNSIRGKPGNGDSGSGGSSARAKPGSSASNRSSSEGVKPVKRTDSGYKSASDGEDDGDNDGDNDGSSGPRRAHDLDLGYGSDEEGAAGKSGRSGASRFRRRSKTKAASNTCTLEFSNYAHVDLQRRGGSSSKKYEFSYWGKSYAWRRSLAADGEHVTFRLVNKATGNEVALIRPDSLTAEAAALDDAIGGVVPPCSMYIHDSPADPVNSSNCDVAE